MKKQRIWISYDLGVNGDYEGIYEWLDFYEAVECGDSLASLVYEYEDNLLKEIQADIKEYCKLDRRDRIYMISVADNGGKRKVAGSFIFGKRKRTPWYGYAEGTLNVEDFDIL